MDDVKQTVCILRDYDVWDFTGVVIDLAASTKHPDLVERDKDNAYVKDEDDKVIGQVNQTIHVDFTGISRDDILKSSGNERIIAWRNGPVKENPVGLLVDNMKDRNVIKRYVLMVAEMESKKGGKALDAVTQSKRGIAKANMAEIHEIQLGVFDKLIEMGVDTATKDRERYVLKHGLGDDSVKVAQ